jgi:hypothetical protein
MSADTDTQETIGWRAEKWTIVAGLVITVVAAVGAFLVFPPEQHITLPNNPKPLILFPQWASIALAVIFGLFSGGLGIVVGAYIKSVMGRQKEQRDLIELVAQAAARTVGGYMLDLVRRLSLIEDRLPKMRELTAFFTDSNKLESHLDYLHTAHGGLAWIVAKFISEKISNSFVKKWTIEINGSRYSRFAAKLYQECDDSIYLTSPFTPRQWFEYLTETQVKQIKDGQHLSEEEIPEHVHALLHSPAPRKKRLVILDDSAWSEVECDTGCGGGLTCLAKLRLLKEFLRVNGENLDTGESLIETRFAKVSNLQGEITEYVPTTDYAIFDKELALRWEDIPGSAHGDADGASTSAEARKHRNLILSPELSEAEHELVRLFETRYHKHLVRGKDLVARFSHAVAVPSLAPGTGTEGSR